ncbi:MAG: hypothetical protein LQ338_004080 [Usnochroma carphineum]|nr:MAG: hypothetical protein LQ338_004080 [Usnochroma carphineum]
MPSNFCAIVSSIAAAIISLFSVPILHEYGLVPYFGTLPSQPTYAPNPAVFDDGIFLNIYQQSSNMSNDSPTPWPAHLLHQDPLIVTTAAFEAEPKPSSSTTTTPPTASPTAPSPPSAWSFYRFILLRLTSAVLTTLAALSLRLAEFLRLHPTMPGNNLIVVKKRTRNARNAVLTEADFLGFPPLERHETAPAPTYVDKGTDVPTSLPPSPTSQEPTPTTPPPTPTYSNAAIGVPTSLPPPPAPTPAPVTAAPASQPSPPQIQFRPTAMPFQPRPAGPSTDTPEEFKQRFPMHGTRAFGRQ